MGRRKFRLPDKWKVQEGEKKSVEKKQAAQKTLNRRNDAHLSSWPGKGLDLKRKRKGGEKKNTATRSNLRRLEKGRKNQLEKGKKLE